MTQVRKLLRIHGQVQGVWYRAWSRETAKALGLRGWVRNRTDGTVEMLVAGDPAAVERMIERCRDGPPSAQVERIDVEETEEEAPVGFESRATS